MKISKRQLYKIIREEKRKVLEGCGDPSSSIDIVDIEAPALEPSIMAENEGAEGELVVEMEVASRALEQVVESVQNAAQLCPSCTTEISTLAPMMEAMAAQADALQEMLDAQTQLVTESIGLGTEADVVDVIATEL